VRKIGIIMLISLQVLLASCEKCMTCTTVNKATGAVVSTYPEICGRKNTLNTQELNYRFSLPDSVELNCPRGKD
jgi:hypothetical protein